MSELTTLEKKKLELVRAKKAFNQQLTLCFDPFEPGSRPTSKQLSILEDKDHRIFWILGGNRSGKSALGSRIVSWWFNDNHPYMNRPDEWGNAPLQIIIIGRTMEQIESELWERKIKPLLIPGTFKEVRIGNALQRIINTENGNRIIFASHNNPAEAREKVQAFTANIVWLDEMPGAAGLVTELLMRTSASRGFFYSTFTPLERVPEIRQIIDSPMPGARKECLLLLDNPVYKGREEEMAAQIKASCSSEAEFRARMYGEWYEGESRVFAYDSQRNYISTPPFYSTMWPHVVVVDPSASGLTGLTVWGRSPETMKWYCVMAEYVNGSAAFELVNEVESRIKGFNVVMRRCDCNPAGFYKEANSTRRGLHYLAVSDKKDRKLDTIDKLNVAWKTQEIFITEAARKLADEMAKAVWSERTNGAIVGESRLHLSDTARYFWDTLPTLKLVPNLTPDERLRFEWNAKCEREADKQIAVSRRIQVRQRRSALKGRSRR